MSVSRSRDYNKSLQKQDHDDNNDNGQKSPASFVMSTLLSRERSRRKIPNFSTDFSSMN